MLNIFSWEREIEKVPKTCHFNFPNSSHIQESKQRRLQQQQLQRQTFFRLHSTSASVTERWDEIEWKEIGVRGFPTASHLTLLRHRVILIVHRFASSTNCLFMHSAERRFCCHKAQLSGRGWGNVMTSVVHLSPHQFTSRMKWGQNILSRMRSEFNWEGFNFIQLWVN